MRTDWWSRKLRKNTDDSRMLCYLSKCSTSSNIVIRMIDSYVLIIALDSLHFLVERKKIWMEFEWQQRGSNHNHLVRKRILNHLGQKKIRPVSLNGWVFVYELSGCGLESRCCHWNFRYGASFEQGVPWHSSKLKSVDSLWNSYVIW